MSPPTSPKLLRRTSIHPLLRGPALFVAWTAGWPMFHLMGATVGWPRLLGSRGIRPRGGDFGAYQATAQDVFAAVYFKSGTSWSMQIAQQIALRGADDYAHIHDVVAWPDAMHPRYAVPVSDPAPAAAAPTGLRVIKTHLPQARVPWSPDAKYLSVLRDPKDVFVSSYHFVRAVALGPMMPPVSAWLDHFLSPGFAWGSWAAHVQDWWSRRELDNVLVLTFDEMKDDLPGAVDRVASLMGVELDARERADVLRHASFEYMQEREDRFGPGMVTPWGATGGAMLRKGGSGGSSELLSPEQQRRIDEHCRQGLLEEGCDLPYDELFARG